MTATAQEASLMPASWNDSPARQAIVQFVERVTQEGGRDCVPNQTRLGDRVLAPIVSG
jgi:hypothetical protein